jgi:hypothetical protein
MAYAFRKAAQMHPQNCGFADKMAKVRDDLRKTERDDVDRSVTVCRRGCFVARVLTARTQMAPVGKNIGRKRAE